MKIGLVGCSKSKLKYDNPARMLYTGNTFSKLLQASEEVNDITLILSGKLGVINPDDIISTYECYLGDQSDEFIREWAEEVKKQLPKGDYIYYCGIDYWKYLPDGEHPMEGMSQGIGGKFAKEFRADTVYGKTKFSDLFK